MNNKVQFINKEAKKILVILKIQISDLKITIIRKAVSIYYKF